MALLSPWRMLLIEKLKLALFCEEDKVGSSSRSMVEMKTEGFHIHGYWLGEEQVKAIQPMKATAVNEGQDALLWIRYQPDDVLLIRFIDFNKVKGKVSYIHLECQL